MNARNFYAKIITITAICSLSLSTFGNIDQAKALLNDGKTSEALTVLEKIIATNTNPEAEFMYAVSLQTLGRRSDAMEAYARMIQNYPELPEPYNNLAVMHAEDKNFEKAVQMLERAISTNDSYATAYENLGDIYSQQASDAYNDALALNPPNRSTVEVKLNLIDNILLPPDRRKPILTAANSSPAISQPITNESANNQSGSIQRPSTPPPVATTVNETSNPTPTANPGLDINEMDAIAAAVSNWAKAWSDQDLAGYLSYYADSFQPSNGATRSAWANYRAEKLQSPSFINVAVLGLDITETEAGAQATFEQSYQSNSFEDRVLKTLDLIKTNQGWKIYRENSRPL